MEEGTLAKWLVKEGDNVSSGDILAEIETDKATMEFEAVDEGVIGKILVPEGSEGVKVNTAIATLLEDGDAADAEPDTAKTEDKAEETAAAAPVAAKAATPDAPNGPYADAGRHRGQATDRARGAARCDGRRDARR